jgi:hypothetical protein
VPLQLAGAALAGLGVVVGAIALAVLRASDARPAMARRLAGPPEVKVGHLLDLEPLPGRAVRVAGRVRCREPLDTGDGEKLVVFHRDVEARVGGRWRALERLREARSFELWDHDGSLTLDPARAAEPLITIPKVWRGRPDQLVEPHASALARLVERHGPATEARATTRTLNVTDRLLVLARPTRGAGGKVRLEPPEGGYLVTNLELPDAMRILAGHDRRAAVGGVIGLALAIALVAIGAVGLGLSSLLGT